jgi:D-glycero-D-manno-heptose 1,7-bisphosphate phosphatase
MRERTSRKAVFLDRDGVINEPVVREGKPYPPASVAAFRIYPETAPACKLLKEAGFLLVVATNQPDVGRGTQQRAVVEAIHARMCESLPIDRVEVCYDSHEGLSGLYKPAPGMLFQAAEALLVDLRLSYVVGDRWRDIDCGHAAGCTTVFIDRGYREALRKQPHFRAASLAEAAAIILRNSVPEHACR